MSITVLEHIKVKDIPVAWRKKLKPGSDQTFTITLKPEAIKPPLSRKERNRLLGLLEKFKGNEDSEEWIKNIKSSRTRSELKVPLT